MSSKKGNHDETPFERQMRLLSSAIGCPYALLTGHRYYLSGFSPAETTLGEMPEATITIIPTETKDAPETVQQTSTEEHEPASDRSDQDTQRQ